jgi:Cu-processing system permease protein
MASVESVGSKVRVVRAVAWVTLRELLRDRVLYAVLVGSILVFGVALLGSRLSAVTHHRLVLDFGFSAVSLSALALGLLSGSVLIGREVDRRTLQVAVARPVSRTLWLVGKFSGAAATLAISTASMALAWWLLQLLSSVVTRGEAGLLVSPLLQSEAVLLAWLQGVMVVALAFLFAAFSTPTLSALLAFGVFVVGSNASQWDALARDSDVVFTKISLTALGWVIPRFELMQSTMSLSYGVGLPAEVVLAGVGYALAWSVAALAGAGWLLERREI